MDKAARKTALQDLADKLGDERASEIGRRFISELLSPTELAQLTGWEISSIYDLLSGGNFRLTGRVGARRGGFWAIAPTKRLLPDQAPFLFDELNKEYGDDRASEIINDLLADLVDVGEISRSINVPTRTVRYRLNSGVGGSYAKKINAEANAGTTWVVLKDAVTLLV